LGANVTEEAGLESSEFSSVRSDSGRLPVFGCESHVSRARDIHRSIPGRTRYFAIGRIPRPASSFVSREHLARVQDEARALVAAVLAC